MDKKTWKTILLAELVTLTIVLSVLAGLVFNDRLALNLSKSFVEADVQTKQISPDISGPPDSKLVFKNPNGAVESQFSPIPTTYDCGPPEDWVPYTVGEGDKLNDLLDLFSTKLDLFQRSNCLGESEIIVSGQTVFVPPQAESISEFTSPEYSANGYEDTPGLYEDGAGLTSGSTTELDESRAAAGTWIEVWPDRYPGYLANPGIGWQYYFSSSRVNSIPQTVTYGERDQLHWANLNPADGVYDWTWLDSQMSTAVSRGEQFSFRIYTSADSHKMPQWVLHAGAKLLANGGLDHQSCVYQEKWGQFVNALIARYDGHPDIAYIDISGYGDFNEWSWETQTEWDYVWADNYEAGTANASSMSTLDSYSRRRLADIFIGGSYSGHQCKDITDSVLSLDYSYPGFQDTQLVMPYAGIRQSTQYVFLKRKDVGFRYDCLGRESSNDILSKLGAELKEIWPKAPVVLETCVPSAFNFNAAQFQSGEMHASLFHNAKIDFTDNQIETLAGNSGYRFHMLYAGYDGVVNPGGTMEIDLGFRNVGNTPVYPKMGQQFSLHIYVTELDGTVLEDFNSQADISTWYPGLNTRVVAKGEQVSESVTVAPNISDGTYRVMVGIINERTGDPINLDVDIEPVNGLYPLGELIVSSP